MDSTVHWSCRRRRLSGVRIDLLLVTEAREIRRAIKTYASAYKDLQKLQESSSHSIPEGDQKTGCIGEFYAYQYLRKFHPEEEVKYGDHNQKGWDIRIGQKYRVQVKTVSAYSKKRGMSPLHEGWDKLYVIYLDCLFKPKGFWIVDYSPSIFEDIQTPLKGLVCPGPGNKPTGSKAICFGEDRVEELRRVLDL